MRDATTLLVGFLAAVRRFARRRAVLSLGLEIFIVAQLCALALLGVVAWTLRGDLGQVAAAGVGAVLLAAATGVATHRLRRLRSPIAAARAIARAEGPLRVRATASELRADAVLRHEILGATELADALERGGEHPSLASPELASAYVERIGELTTELDARLALPPPRLGLRVLLAALVFAGLLGFVGSEVGMRAATLVLSGSDARPLPPPAPVWTSLELTLDYPEHTRRPDRRVPNPSGSLRVPAGTSVQVLLHPSEPSPSARTGRRSPSARTGRRSPEAMRVVVVYDTPELARAREPELFELESIAGTWQGGFIVRGAGSWTVVAIDDLDDDDQRSTRRSPTMRIELEADGPPEVELLPLPEGQREASETDSIDLRFSARDDFGVVEAELVYELGDGNQQRLPAGEAPGGASRSWRHRYAWDLSAIPIEERSELTYWIEVRDNDPGLGLVPLVDGPGKVAASARQRLALRDREAEHATNIRDLQALRDAAVDLLALRLTTKVFESDNLLPETRRLELARAIHESAANLLTLIASAVDALAVDTMVDERDVAGLAAIHERLLELHHDESALLDDLPPGAEPERSDEIAPLLSKLGKHNQREISQLEDEIIRLDDLVDGQIIERIEALVARLETSQRKLVEKLEQLAAGDESVRSEIDQLEQRIREDMRRLQEARSQLRREVGDEWMNLDAFKAMEARMRSQELMEQLRSGDVEGAVQQAREGLEAIGRLRDQVQREGAQDDVPLSEEDRKRMKMLRELSRLQDDEAGLRSETRRLREQWRAAVGETPAEPATVEQTKRDAEQLREQLERINDARLSREGRRAWEDAREALQELEAASEDGAATQLELFEAAERAAEALERASGGAEARESEGKSLEQLSKRAQRLRQQLRAPLPDPEDVLDSDARERLDELAKSQQGVRDRAQRLLDDPAADILPEPGRQAMRRGDQAMQQAGEDLDGSELDGALGSEERAWQGLQQAIDSLRQSSPPPSAASGGEASTEAERDRSLRDQVIEAMREGEVDQLDPDTKRYYEELLR